MAYEYDLFLSYKRHPEARRWLVEHFQPLLELHVELELGRSPVVFRDDQDGEAGTAWPAALGRALGNSRVLVALWTKTYFFSDWCGRELSTMLAREHDEQFRTATNPASLIVPIVLHDCETVPHEVSNIEHVAIRECFNVRMTRESALGESLVCQIRDRIAPCVATAIRAAPDWREAWPLTTAERFLAAVRNPGRPSQTKVPR